MVKFSIFSRMDSILPNTASKLKIMATWVDEVRL